MIANTFDSLTQWLERRIFVRGSNPIKDLGFFSSYDLSFSYEFHIQKISRQNSFTVMVGRSTSGIVQIL